MDNCLQKMNNTSHTMQDWSQVTENTPAEAIDYDASLRAAFTGCKDSTVSIHVHHYNKSTLMYLSIIEA